MIKATRSNKSQRHGQKFMKKTILMIITGIICTLLSYGQNKVLLENGNSVVYSAISIENERVKVYVNGETQFFKKADILCIVPKKGKSYSFREKDNRKTKISKKDIKHDYQGSDIPRLFAYKYYKSKTDVNTLYNKYQNITLSQFDFEGYYKTQQKKIRSRATTGTIIGVVILAISVGGLIRTISNANEVSYNDHEQAPPNFQQIKYQSNYFGIVNQRDLKLCA